MSDELTYDVAKTNASECYGRFGFMLGGRAVRLDEPQEPVAPEPMRTQRRAVRLSQPLDRESDLKPEPVQKAKEPLDFDVEELQALLSGEPEPTQEPEPEPPPAVVELDRRPTFRDLLLAKHGGQTIVQAEPDNSFVGFLRNHYRDERDRLKAMIDDA